MKGQELRPERLTFDPSSGSLPLSPGSWAVSAATAACCFRTGLSALICSQSSGRELLHRSASGAADMSPNMSECLVTDLLDSARGRVSGLCVLFQSSKLLGLGSPLSAHHSATLMATWTLKFYSELPGRSGRWGWRKCLLALLCTAGGHAAILLLHKRLLQVPVWQWPLDHWSIMIAG